MPKEDLDALLNPPESLNEIIDGSSEDTIQSKLQSNPDEELQTAYAKALVSTKVVSKYDNQNIRLPGFIVPLEFDDDFVVTEFFLVPFFGACLHLPPPPPNQIIYVKYEEGMKLASTGQPYWVSGTLSAQSKKNELAHSAYSMTATKVTVYEETYEDEE